MKHRSVSAPGQTAFSIALIAIFIAVTRVSPALADDSLQLTVDYSKHCKQPGMPPLSQQLAESGLVRVWLQLAADGTIDEARVAHSSGFTRLDEAALQSVRSCRFNPPYADSNETPIKGEIKIRFSFDVRSWFPLRGVAEVEYLKKLVAGMSDRCQSHGADPDGQVARNQATWHQRNDAIALLVNDYRNLYEADIRQYISGKDAEIALRALEREMESRVEPASSQAYASFEALPANQQMTYCQRYGERLAAGKFDLMRTVIAYPELELFIRNRSPQRP